jgi:CRISPR/Cas system-associated protein endoribonuclease Cas2
MKLCLEEETSEFDLYSQQLAKLHIEAKDNVKFLSTLERHLKMMSRYSVYSLLVQKYKSTNTDAAEQCTSKDDNGSVPVSLQRTSDGVDSMLTYAGVC